MFEANKDKESSNNKLRGEKSIEAADSEKNKWAYQILLFSG